MLADPLDQRIALPTDAPGNAQPCARAFGPSQLEGIENKIRIARSDYIQAVRQYNTEITTIPGRWWRAFVYPDKTEMAAFDIPADEQKTPKVDFGTDKK